VLPLVIVWLGIGEGDHRRLNYIVPTQDRPRSFTYDPGDGSPRTTVTTAPHILPVHDMREEDQAFTLDGEGFAVVEHRSAVTDLQDEAQIRDTYYAEAERLLKDVTGADRVFIFDHTLRRCVPGQQDYGGRACCAGGPPEASLSPRCNRSTLRAAAWAVRPRADAASGSSSRRETALQVRNS
jgi:hypothetical protein